jgi:GAF domain-containing protein
MSFSNPKFANFNDVLLQLSRSPILDSGELEKTIHFVLETAAHCLDVQRLSVWVYNLDKTKLKCLSLYEKSSSSHVANGVEISTEDYPIYFEALGYQRVLAIQDVKTDRRTSELLQTYMIPNSIVSMIDAPVREYGEVVGVVCTESVSRMRKWDSNEIYFTGILGDLIARAFLAKKRKDAQDQMLNKIAELEKKLNETNT